MCSNDWINLCAIWQSDFWLTSSKRTARLVSVPELESVDWIEDEWTRAPFSFSTTCRSVKHSVWLQDNIWQVIAVADPGFPRWACQLQTWGANLLFGKIFAENCIKWKKFDWEGSYVPRASPWILHCIRQFCHNMPWECLPNTTTTGASVEREALVERVIYSWIILYL